MNATPVAPIHRRHQRGQAMAYFGIVLLTLTAFAVIGVDVGRLAFTASEVQSVADAAALAAMSAAARKEADPVASARNVIQRNFVDGAAATQGAGATDIIQILEPGTFDTTTGLCTVGGAWPTASCAHARATKTVSNLVAPIIGQDRSTVIREATAAQSGTCAIRPVMPIALPSCQFAQFETSNPPNCSLLPSFTQTPNPAQNTCWTSLSQASANQGAITQYFPTQCCGQGNTCGSNAPPPDLHIGSSINVVNGQIDPVLRVIESCRAQGLNEWDIPIIDCPSCAPNACNCNQSHTVVGFAHIVISSVQPTGGSKGVNLTSVCKTEPDTSGGCVNIGGLTGLALVK